MRSKRLQKAREGKATLEDVAHHASVSTATVSRYLTNSDLVRPARREKIELAIAELGYIPHGAAQALASQRSRAIGAIVPTLDNAIFATGIHAFQKRLQKAGYTLLIASSDYSLEEELVQAETLIARGVDGMMLVGSDHDDRLYARLGKMNLPYVNTWVFDKSVPHACVGFDNLAAAKRQADYLLDIGHQRFGIISGIIKDNDRARFRLQGVLTAIEARGLQQDDVMIYESHYDIAQSRQITRRLIATEPRPTAIICGNDVLAFGAIFECLANRLDVPGDMSIVGFDDLPFSQHIVPALTTVHVPSREMGQHAADYLLARLQKGQIPDHTEIETNLIVRDSAARPRNG
ncbi:MAG: LacI family DNA-binding transcriptional regulator [Pseudomonadota bacterium]